MIQYISYIIWECLKCYIWMWNRIILSMMKYHIMCKSNTIHYISYIIWERLKCYIWMWNRIILSMMKYHIMCKSNAIHYISYIIWECINAISECEIVSFYRWWNIITYEFLIVYDVCYISNHNIFIDINIGGFKLL